MKAWLENVVFYVELLVVVVDVVVEYCGNVQEGPEVKWNEARDVNIETRLIMADRRTRLEKSDGKSAFTVATHCFTRKIMSFQSSYSVLYDELDELCCGAAGIA